MSEEHWIKGKHFYSESNVAMVTQLKTFAIGLDGSTSSSERDRLIGQFNSATNQTCWVFLLSTKY